MLPAIELSRDSAPDYILNSGSGLLTCGCCPEARPRQEPRPAQPRPGQGEGRGGGREHGHGGGESDQGGGQGAGLGHNKQGAYQKVLLAQCPLTARKPSI